MENNIKLVIFKLADYIYGIELNYVDRIVNAVEFRLLPNLPDNISGVINMGGEYIPVVNMYKIFDINKTKTELSDHLIIVSYKSQKYALWTDTTTDLTEISEEEITYSKASVCENKYLSGLFKKDASIVMLCDIENILESGGVKYNTEKYKQ